MKLTKLVGVSALALLALGAGSQVVGAEEVQIKGDKEGKASTPTSVIIKDDDEDPLGGGGEGTENKPGQQHLFIEKVPAGFNFVSTVQKDKYDISATTEKDGIKEPTLSVFNDRSTRQWTLKASVGNGGLSLLGADGQPTDKTFEVTSFSIDDKELAGTGVQTTVLSNTDSATNLKSISKDIKSVNIKFNDPKNELEKDNKLSGEINYNLFFTPEAK